MKQFHIISILLFIGLSSCDRKPLDHADAREELKESEMIQAFDVDRLIGKWVLTYRNGGLSESDTDLTYTFEKSGELLPSKTLSPGGDNHKKYWHIAHLEDGEAIILLEGSSTDPEMMSKKAEFDGSPMVVRIDQSKMEWLAFGRNQPGPAAPTDVVLFRFEKIE